MNELENLRILLVEDDPDDALIIARLLRECTTSCRLETVGRLAAALELGARDDWDVVLSDLTLPDSSAGETVQALQAAFAQVPLVVLTGLDDPEVSQQAIRQGAQDYLVKGRIETDGLMRSISYARERKRLEEAQRVMNLELERRVEQRTAELDRSREALQQHVVELQKFAYLASHDLQTPLREISGFAQFLAMDYQEQLDEQGLEYIHHIVHGVAQMKQLIDAMTAYSAEEKAAPAPVMLSLESPYREALATLQDEIDRHQADIHCEALPELPGDASRLTVLFRHLLSNALAYRGEDAPRIRITAQEAGEEGWCIKVQDNGQGVAPEYHERIFEMFQRLHNQETHPGAGVGLTICRRIVTRHGGRIGVESNGKAGSTFWFTLPAS